MGPHGWWQRRTNPEIKAVVAHRGGWGEAAENTLDAFASAIAVGADMIECDVRRTGDGRLVVCHDPSYGGLPLAGVRHPALAGSGAAPPTLDDVLALARDRIAVNVELKERGCVGEVVRRLERFGPHRCLLTSFHDDVVRAAKAIAPRLPTGLLVGTPWSVSQFVPSGRARRARADVLVVHDRLADAGVLRRAAMPCLVWTVNDPRRIERWFADPHVAGVITDVPQIALRRRSQVSARSGLSAQRGSPGELGP